ncbi:hypothetical protein PsYK624_116940 [Phanerochaete sordida]|uniref:Uncharacterized protein n=1 Tax=Phanerochaete sordida TaxID=48140 RepID=A0A9P3GL76_9APHY|nr:hypothetical protein PsYK624_116940 [Phanerochaete sordida]
MATASRVLSRSLLSRRAIRALPVHARSVQTSTSQAQTGFRGSIATHAAAVAFGAGSVLAGAYAYYHFSGLKALVDKARAAKAKYNHVRSTWSETQPRTPGEALAFLRRVSRSHAGPVPDAFVDMVAQFQGAHEEDIDRIVFGAVDDIQAIIAESRAEAAAGGAEAVGEEGLTPRDRARIAAAVQRHAQALRAYARERRERAPEEGKGKLFARMRTRQKDAEPGAKDSE